MIKPETLQPTNNRMILIKYYFGEWLISKRCIYHMNRKNMSIIVRESNNISVVERVKSAIFHCHILDSRLYLFLDVLVSKILVAIGG